MFSVNRLTTTIILYKCVYASSFIRSDSHHGLGPDMRPHDFLAPLIQAGIDTGAAGDAQIVAGK